jgi:two-component system sensor histidine kinase KdpD
MPAMPRGKLKIFLGYAAGVGKTYQMLCEAQALKRQGLDVVIGYFEPHARKDTIARTEELETVPRRVVEYRGARFEEMDTDAILLRRPEVCVVDEFAHTNVPGSERAKRWEDVEVLRNAGIGVWTTMNVQHLDSLNDQVWQITGVKVRETIPDWVVKDADEVVMVDVTPRALLNRLERGVVYAPDKAQRALDNFFRESSLVALRELALRQTAHEVDLRHTDPEPRRPLAPARTERILIQITPDPTSAILIRRGNRVAEYWKGECLAVFVHSEASLEDVPANQRKLVEHHMTFARNLHLETHVLQGEDIAAALVEFARTRQVTQIFVPRPKQISGISLFRRNTVQRIVELARDMEVTIVAERRRAQVH